MPPAPRSPKGDFEPPGKVAKNLPSEPVTTVKRYSSLDEDELRLALQSAPPIPAPARGPVKNLSPEVASQRDREFQQAKSLAQEKHVRQTGKRRGYFLLLLLFLPLAWSTLARNDDGAPLKQRLEQAFKEAEKADGPGLQRNLIELANQKPDEESWTAHDIINALPNHQLPGAFLTADSWMHWAMAAISAGAFLSMILLAFPLGHAKMLHLLGVAAFTGTGGIMLLLAFQMLALHMPFIVPRGGGGIGLLIVLIIDVIALIGQSYTVIGGNYSFPITFLGFTCGVGLCEEICKALPAVIIAANSGLKSWRAAMLWGMISGVGFGVSEGITYSHDFYNGIMGPEIYAVRFISCVALHAIWSAAVGIAIFDRREEFERNFDLKDSTLNLLKVVLVPMVLHGLYDALLTHDYHLFALVVALLSFGWLAYKIESTGRADDRAGDAAFQ